MPTKSKVLLGELAEGAYVYSSDCSSIIDDQLRGFAACNAATVSVRQIGAALLKFRLSLPRYEPCVGRTATSFKVK